MSEKLGTIEAKETLIRRDLADAIANRSASDANLRNAQLLLGRGKVMLETARADLALLKNSAQTFRRKRTADHASAILATIHGQEVASPDEVTTSPCPQTIEAAETHTSACQQAHDELTIRLTTAQTESARAGSTVRELIDAIIFITAERLASKLIAAQAEVWRLQDSFMAAVSIAGDTATRQIQETVVKRLRRFTASIEDGHPPMDQKMWTDFLDSKAKACEPQWLSFAQRLTADATAVFER